MKNYLAVIFTALFLFTSCSHDSSSSSSDGESITGDKLSDSNSEHETDSDSSPRDETNDPLTEHDEDAVSAGCDIGTGGLSLYPNIETAGVKLSGENLPGSAKLQFRKTGSASWIEGHPLIKTDDGNLYSSLFSLVRNTSYEILVTAEGEIETCMEMTTEPDEIVFQPERLLHVNASSDPGGDGSSQAPFRTIQAAVDAATPGTSVKVADGIYNEQVTISSAQSDDKWIEIIAEGDKAVLDGSYEPNQANWHSLSSAQGVWSIEVNESFWYLARDGERFYRYNSYDDLLAGAGDDNVPMSEGWFIEDGSTTLFVRVTSDPTANSWNIPLFDSAFDVLNSRNIRIEGFEMRFYGRSRYGKGVYINNSSNVVVRKNRIHGIPNGVWIKWTSGAENGNDNRVEYNDISDPPIYSWPWDAVKGTSMENSAVIASGRSGAIVRGNKIHNIFNGIYTGSFSDDENLALSFDVDAYDNEFREIGDDAMEPEGSCINNRFRNNHFDNGFVGASIAPVTNGPLWLLRNSITNYKFTGFKWSNDSDGKVYVYHNTCWTDEEDQNGMGFSGLVHNVTFRNNIIRGTRYAFESSRTGMTGHDWDFDNWYTTRAGPPHFKWENVRYDTIQDLCQGAGFECSGHENEPGLKNPESGDASLSSGSPNIDSGIKIPGINDSHCGTNPDIGFYEFCD